MTLAVDVIKKMTQRSVTLATCESLTGGGIGAALTSVPGASAVYRGSLVTYARELKSTLAGVDEELIATEGVVNELTALQMARGAQARCDADWAVATTGVAGPTETDGAMPARVPEPATPPLPPPPPMDWAMMPLELSPSAMMVP